MVLKRRHKNFTEGVDLFKNFQKVTIYEMNFAHYSWNYFDAPVEAIFKRCISYYSKLLREDVD